MLDGGRFTPYGCQRENISRAASQRTNAKHRVILGADLCPKISLSVLSL